MQVEKNGSETKAKNQTTIERKSDLELVVTRTFNGPATIVFDAWTKPELVLRWWAPRSTGMRLVTCEIDLRVGGKYRYVFAGKNGEKAFEAFGKYTVVDRPRQLAWTDDDQLVDGATGEAVSTLRLAEKGGKTTVIYTSRFPLKEALDGVFEGMEQGTLETFEQLAELLAAKNDVA